MDKWRYSGFNVYGGARILHWQKKSVENLARYRATFAQERMTYVWGSAQVVYLKRSSIVINWLIPIIRFVFL